MNMLGSQSEQMLLAPQLQVTPSFWDQLGQTAVSTLMSGLINPLGKLPGMFASNYLSNAFAQGNSSLGGQQGQQNLYNNSLQQMFNPNNGMTPTQSGAGFGTDIAALMQGAAGGPWGMLASWLMNS
jgi:hypothetical protein